MKGKRSGYTEAQYRIDFCEVYGDPSASGFVPPPQVDIATLTESYAQRRDLAGQEPILNEYEQLIAANIAKIKATFASLGLNKHVKDFNDEISKKKTGRSRCIQHKYKQCMSANKAPYLT